MKFKFIVFFLLAFSLPARANEEDLLPKAFKGEWVSLSSNDVPHAYNIKENGEIFFIAKEPYYSINKNEVYNRYQYIRTKDHTAYILVKNTHKNQLDIWGLEIFNPDEGENRYQDPIIVMYGLNECIKIEDADWKPFKKEKLYNLITHMLLENPTCTHENGRTTYVRR